MKRASFATGLQTGPSKSLNGEKRTSFATNLQQARSASRDLVSDASREVIGEASREVHSYTMLSRSDSLAREASDQMTREEVLAWLTGKDNEEDALWVFAEVGKRSASLWRSAVANYDVSQSHQLGMAMGHRVTRITSNLALGAFIPSASLNSEECDEDDEDEDSSDAPLLLFEAGVYISDESDETDPVVQLVILRKGNLTASSEVSYSTVDGSARAGYIYEAVSGRVVFEIGEDRKEIEIRMMPNEVWDATLEFKVRLGKEGTRNAKLDPYMRETRIQVFNDDPFPTNACKDLLLQGRSSEVPKLTMLRAYVRVMQLDAVVWSRTLRHLAYDSLHNIRMAISLFMNVYLFDHILNVHAKKETLFMDSRMASLFFLVGLDLLLLFIAHVADYAKSRYAGLNGPLMSSLKLSILRQFFHCQRVCRVEIGSAGLLQSMTNDVEQVAAGSYLTVVKLCRNLGELTMLILFQCISPFVFGTSFKPLPMMIISLFPVFMLSFLAFRAALGHERLNRCAVANLVFCKFVDQICSNFDMMFTFAKHHEVEFQFRDKVQEFQTSSMLCGVFGMNNRYFTMWLSALAVAGYIVIGGMNVIHGVTSLGYLVTNMQIISMMGKIWGDIYDNLTAIDGSFPALHRITNFLNTPTDLVARQEVFERNEIINTKLGNVDIDDRPIIVQGFGALLAQRLGKAPSEEIVDIRIDQGQMIAITSPSGCGKGTLLKLLGGLMFSVGHRDTFIFVPPHLRVLAIGNAPLFFKGKILDNLIFGVGTCMPDARLERILKICKKLGLRQSVLSRIEANDEILDWAETFPGSTLQLLNIGRALIANPDVLCLDKPTSGLDSGDTRLVLNTLREFIQNKGLAIGSEESSRRPRTAIYTTGRMLPVDRADIILFIDESTELKEIPKDEFTEDMMSHEEDRPSLMTRCSK